MYWYLAKIVFQIVTPGESVTGQFEEIIRLVRAPNKLAALSKVSAWGERESLEFVNSKGDPIRWEFIAVSELRCLPALKDGIELDSHLQEIPAKDEFITLQRDKHKRLFLTATEPGK